MKKLNKIMLLQETALYFVCILLVSFLFFSADSGLRSIQSNFLAYFNLFNVIGCLIAACLFTLIIKLVIKPIMDKKEKRDSSK